MTDILVLSLRKLRTFECFPYENDGHFSASPPQQTALRRTATALLPANWFSSPQHMFYTFRRYGWGMDA